VEFEVEHGKLMEERDSDIKKSLELNLEYFTSTSVLHHKYAAQPYLRLDCGNTFI
jgi:hypothetical protein